MVGSSSNHPCPSCQGRGWVAATDGWVWWRAIQVLPWDVMLQVFPAGAEQRGFRATVTDENADYFVWDDDPEAAFFAALEKAVVAADGVLLEVADA